MAYEICSMCGKFFKRNGRRFCEDCFEKTEKEYDLIVEYIKTHHNATVLDIISDTGVSLKTIDCLVEEGYVTYIENKVQTSEEEQSLEKTPNSSKNEGKFYSKGLRY
ncbi:hypothetical protein K8M07_06255 [Schnuerera sp. xch1]|uniref:hypothetical protein n=1 Tax=Schnuerera sp. xch1 TaxID=2874283 RepID=UPI001CBC2480|nr:hypothetical protein [Schnuerera sp. xch1]MBZ2174849.1 hypothetical protein [Schnuerera sp. xch1]